VPDFALERGARGLVCGIDEAGRGPLAGPVVAAAVILDRARFPCDLEMRLNDSKAMTEQAREASYRALDACALIGLGAASAREIDARNILGATLLAMARAVAALPLVPDIALIDGNAAPQLPCPVQAVVGGDSRSFSIAAASVVAKVTRDRLMRALAARYPGYGWERNFGYPTPEHRAALLALGPTPHHRRSFAPLSRPAAADEKKSAARSG
jgi:ribonuclease HII